MQILLGIILKDKYKKFVSKFVSAGGWKQFKLFQDALIQIPLLFFVGLIMPFVVVTLKILKPIIKIRFGFVPDERIGELTHRIDLYMRRQTMCKNSNKEFHVFFSGKSPNQQIVTMIKRRLFVLENRFLAYLYKIAHQYTSNSKIWLHLPFDHAAFWEFNQIPVQIAFTPEERKKGQDKLFHMGIKSGDSFVCFHARDKAYLDTIHKFRSREEWACHDYRDSEIHHYLLAAEYLVSLGLFAIRMGYIVERSLKTSNPRIIDYATHHRSDFMDIYLLGNCKFFLGNSAGLFCVAQAFGIPVAVANWIPIKWPFPCKHDLFIPKKLWDIEKKRFLPFSEIITLGIDSWLRTEQYIKARIEVVENTAEEILDLAKEMKARIDNTWITTEEDEGLQQRYRDLFPPTHYSFGFPSRIGAEFLRQNRELLE